MLYSSYGGCLPCDELVINPVWGKSALILSLKIFSGFKDSYSCVRQKAQHYFVENGLLLGFLIIKYFKKITNYLFFGAEVVPL